MCFPFGRIWTEMGSVVDCGIIVSFRQLNKCRLRPEPAMNYTVHLLKRCHWLKERSSGTKFIRLALARSCQWSDQFGSCSYFPLLLASLFSYTRQERPPGDSRAARMHFTLGQSIGQARPLLVLHLCFTSHQLLSLPAENPLWKLNTDTCPQICRLFVITSWCIHAFVVTRCSFVISVSLGCRVRCGKTHHSTAVEGENACFAFKVEKICFECHQVGSRLNGKPMLRQIILLQHVAP